jgi:tankyrase
VLQVAEYLLEQGADVNAQDKGGLIPLHNASSYGHLDIAALLIKYNTIVNATGNINITTSNSGVPVPTCKVI